MLKNILISVLALFFITGLSNAAIRHYEQYKQTQKHQVQLAAAKQVNLEQQIKDIKQSAATEYVSLQGAYNQAVAECHKGATAYANLAATTKQKVPAPSCPAPAK